MTDSRKLSAVRAAAVCGALILIGCHGTTPPPEPDKGATTPATMPSMSMAAGDQGKPPLPPRSLPKPDPKSMTHMLTKEEPYYDSMPGADAKSVGMLSKGSKVLLMVPGTTYSKVLTDEGIEVYTMTEGLDPIPAGK